MFLPLRYSRRVPKAEENGIVGLILYKNQYCLLEMHAPTKNLVIAINFSEIVYPINQLMQNSENHREVLLEHEPRIIKFPKEISFRFSESFCKLHRYLLGFAGFEAMSKKDDTLKGKLTKNFYEQIAVRVQFYLPSELGNPSSFDLRALVNIV